MERPPEISVFLAECDLDDLVGTYGKRETTLDSPGCKSPRLPRVLFVLLFLGCSVATMLLQALSLFETGFSSPILLCSLC